jgi:hypothetical protein
MAKSIFHRPARSAENQRFAPRAKRVTRNLLAVSVREEWILSVSTPNRSAPFPLTLLSERLTMEEFFHFHTMTARIQAAHGLVRPLDLQAFAVESPDSWNTPLAAPEEDHGYDGPARLVLIAVAPAMRDALFAAGLSCDRSRRTELLIGEIGDGPGFFPALFDKLAKERMPIATVAIREPGKDASRAMAVLARTPRAIARIKEALRIGEWKMAMMPGWSCHHRFDPMPIARMPDDVSLGGFFSMANQVSNARVGAPVFLNVQLFALLASGAPLGDQPPERLMVATMDPILRTGLQSAAHAVGAPRRTEDLKGFVPPSNGGQPGIFAEMFRDMETRGLTVLTWMLQNSDGPDRRTHDGGSFILARTTEASAALLEKLGIGGLEPFEPPAATRGAPRT